MCCLLLLPFAAIVFTAPIRARRENVLSFLNDALATVTVPASVTAYRNSPSKTVTEKDSQDVSDARSTESFDTNGFPDAAKDLESHEIMIPKVAKNDNTPSGRRTGADKDSMDASRRLVQDHGSRELNHLDSEEGMTMNTQEHGNLSGKRDIRSSGDKVTDSASEGANLQRKAGRVNGLNSMLAPGQSREMLDRDSLENSNGRLAAVGNSRDTDYDETREYISSEMHPIAPPQHKPSSLSVPAKG
ncbi:uncharacterized protein LOC108890864 [Lates calcarifer]|uniref:Uncharacterized protein LOC108890864 n=1 Tax=Lates calcarifer TaxID=8187 RepID=A0AAJ7Q0F8_LATCA|nr:uncharacterized protein LOC108890864 [Lates calcarifer]